MTADPGDDRPAPNGGEGVERRAPVRELYPQNAFYGCGSILRRYAGLRVPLPLPVLVQHGAYVGPNEDDARGASEMWCWSGRLARESRASFPGERVRAVGAPLLYLKRMLGVPDRPDRSARGTLVMPCHSSHRIEAHSDFEAYAEMLTGLPPEFSPIRVCVYYRDAAQGAAEPFRRRGFEVVSNGRGRDDGRFLHRCLANLRASRYFLTNSFGTAPLYAAALGLRAFLFGPPTQLVGGDAAYRAGLAGPYGVPPAWEPLFRFPSGPEAGQRDLATAELGQDHLLEPGEMRRLLLRLSFRARHIRRVTRRVSGGLNRRAARTLRAGEA